MDSVGVTERRYRGQGREATDSKGQASRSGDTRFEVNGKRVEITPK